MKILSVLILCFSFSQAQDFSQREYERIDEQTAYNVVKKIFVSSHIENVVDTNWSSLHISQRNTSGFLDITMSIDNILLTTKYNDSNDSKTMRLKIFTTVDDENSSLSPDSFLHTLMWNRIEYALEIQKDWIECITSMSGLFYINNPLCSIDKQNIRIE